MTAGDRLRQLAGQAGAAGVLLLLIGSGVNAGAALVDYSGLATRTAAQHLLTDVVKQRPAGATTTQGISKPKLILVEHIHEFDDLVEQVTELVKEQPKVKAQLRKAKPLKPAEATTDHAQEWLDYWAALLDSLRNQEYANRLYAELQQTMAMIDALIQRQELAALMQEEMRREEEEFMVLMLMVNT